MNKFYRPYGTQRAQEWIRHDDAEIATYMVQLFLKFFCTDCEIQGLKILKSSSKMAILNRAVKRDKISQKCNISLIDKTTADYTHQATTILKYRF